MGSALAGRIAAFLGAWLACAIVSVPAAAATLVRVGVYEFPPYVTEGGGGVTQALLDLLNAEQGEHRFEAVLTAPQRRYADFDQARFDALVFESVEWGWRGRPVEATRPFFRDAEVFVAKAGPGVDQRAFDDLTGRSILGRLGYHYAFAGFETAPDVLAGRFNTRLTTTHEGNVRSVAAGRAQLAIVTRSFLAPFLRANPDLAAQVLVSERVDQVYEHTVLVRRGGPVSAAGVDALLGRLEAEGKLAALWARTGIAP